MKQLFRWKPGHLTKSQRYPERQGVTVPPAPRGAGPADGQVEGVQDDGQPGPEPGEAGPEEGADHGWQEGAWPLRGGPVAGPAGGNHGGRLPSIPGGTGGEDDI